VAIADKEQWQFYGVLTIALGALISALWPAFMADEKSCSTFNMELREENYGLMRENVELINDLASKINSQAVLGTTLDGIRHPIWVNEVVHLDKPNAQGKMIDFRMVHINLAFQSKFEVSNTAYQGKTAFEIGWPPKTADLAYYSDLMAYQKGTIRAPQTFTSVLGGVDEVTEMIDKTLVRMPDGREVLICMAYTFGMK